MFHWVDMFSYIMMNTHNVVYSERIHHPAAVNTNCVIIHSLKIALNRFTVYLTFAQT